MVAIKIYIVKGVANTIMNRVEYAFHFTLHRVECESLNGNVGFGVAFIGADPCRKF